MIKILHTGDIHLGDLAGPTKDGANLRRQDTLRCMDAIVNKARTEGPTVTIIAGDLFNRSRVWADTALDDVNDAISRFIVPLCEYSDAVVLLFGTMNHDNPRAFEVIRKATPDLKNLHIYTEPRVERLVTSEGPVQIMAVPGFDKARLRLFCPGADKETENRNATALVNDIILGLATELDRSLPSILTAHYTVSGSEADNGSTFLAGQDVVVLPATIDAAGVDLACFGHIHKPQRLSSTTSAYSPRAVPSYSRFSRSLNLTTRKPLIFLIFLMLPSFLSALPSSDRVGQFPVTPFRAFRLSGGSLQSFRSPSGCPWRTRPAASSPVAFPASAWPPAPPSCRTSGRCPSGCPLATARAARRMPAHTAGRCAVAPSCCCSFLQNSSGQWRDDADRVVVLVQND